MKDYSNILKKPHVTEKATMAGESSVYVFQIDPRVNKKAVAAAFKEKYKFDPIKVATVTIHSKSVVVRGKRGMRSGYKKAYVYLKKGTKIENL